MGLSSHRYGRGKIRSADELREILTIPCFYILKGMAQAAFPYSATPAPSYFVKVILVRNIRNRTHQAGFPVYVNWRQWNEVVVPVLEAQIYSMWTGSLGGSTGVVGGPSALNGGSGTAPGGGNGSGSGNGSGGGNGSSSLAGFPLQIPDIPLAPGGVYCGLTESFLDVLGDALWNQAVQAGYGAPDQEGC